MASSPQNEPTMEEILASIRKIISEDSTSQAPAEEESLAQELPAPEQEPEPAPAPVPEAAPEPDFGQELAAATEEEDDDLLELTPEMEQDAPLTGDDIAFGDPEPEPAPEADPTPELAVAEEAPLDEPMPEIDAPSLPESELPEPELPEPELEPEPTPEPEPEPELNVPDMNMIPPSSATEPESMFSEKSRRALDDAMANLDRTIIDEETAHRASNLEQTVGAIMLNAMREKVDPAVNRWLSENRAEMIAHMKPFVREWLDENFPALLEEAVRSEVARTIKLRSKNS